MFLSQKRALPVLPVVIYSAFGLLLLLAITLRISLFHVVTSDYTVFLSQWYSFIQSHGGFAALKYNFSNYNVPYLYLLALTTYLPIPELVAIKSLSVLFDVLLGLFTYFILRMRYQRSYAAMAGVLVIAFAPTVFINSAAWGQADATYVAFCLGSLYFLLKERPAWACVFFGIAISFKLQAIFFLPVLLILVLKKNMALKYLALIPLVFLLLLVPAFIAGRDALSLLSIYVNQITSGGVGGAGQFTGAGRSVGGTGGTGQFPGGGGTGQFPGGGSGAFNGGGARQFSGGGQGGGNSSSSSLTFNAPSFYQWLSASAPDYWKWIGIGLAGMFVAVVGALVGLSKKLFTPDILLKVTLVLALAIPFLLPEMHDRYFFLADVISIIYAFYFPRLWFIAVIMQVCSLLSYAPYFLNNTQIVSLSYVAFAVLGITVITFVDLVLTLYPNIRASKAIATEASTQ